jgi:hypothetical protein
MSIIQTRIGQAARDHEGLKEIKGNMGFKDEEFEERMEMVGWKQTQAWCAYFAELIWKLGYAGYDSEMVKRIDKLFSGSAVQTFRNFSKDGGFTVSQDAVEGAVVIWQTYRNGKASWTGHAGIVIGAHDKYFVTMEGNTNSSGGREGIEVARKTRKYTFDTQNGLRLKGFIHPPD